MVINNQLVDSNGYAVHPEYYSLSKVKWSIFGTLTWEDGFRRSDTKEAAWLRKHDFERLMQAAMTHFRIRGKNFGYYFTQERGKGEMHYHFLIADNPKLTNINELVANLSSRAAFTIGRADIRPYNQAQGLAGVAYCLKKDIWGDRIDGFSQGLNRLMASL